MCIFSGPSMPTQPATDTQSRQVKAAGDAAVAARKDAFGAGASLMGGLSGGQPSVARKMLFGA